MDLRDELWIFNLVSFLAFASAPDAAKWAIGTGMLGVNIVALSM